MTNATDSNTTDTTARHPSGFPRTMRINVRIGFRRTWTFLYTLDHVGPLGPYTMGLYQSDDGLLKEFPRQY